MFTSDGSCFPNQGGKIEKRSSKFAYCFILQVKLIEPKIDIFNITETFHLSSVCQCMPKFKFEGK